MAVPASTTGYLSKGVRLNMTAYSASPSFSDSTIVANLQEFPDLLGTPEQVDVTCLEDANRRYIPGIKDVGGVMSFTFLYEKSIFKTFKDAEGSRQSFKIDFPDGVGISFSGYVAPSIIGKGVNDALQFSANITADSEFTVSYPATP